MRSALLLMVGLGVGGLGGWSLRSAREDHRAPVLEANEPWPGQGTLTTNEARPEAPPFNEPRREAAQADVPPPSDPRLARLSQELDSERALRLEREGRAIPPPAHLPPRYDKEPLLAAFRRAAASSGLPVDVTAIDCTEYPCVLVGEVGGKDPAFEDTMAMLDRFFSSPELSAYADDTHHTSVWKAGGHDAQGRPIFAVALYPKEDEGDDLRQRLRYREQELMNASRTDVP